MGFLGDPTRLVMKPENPDFFRSIPGGLESLDSSENLLEAGMPSILDFSLRTDGSDAAVEKLGVLESEGGPMPMLRGTELACDCDRESDRGSGCGGAGAGGAGRWGAW